ncbi:MAG: hypothetical protein M3R00_09125, partial [Pseudomonadota bacterium]|nr:hypothetical protein [Pseudomonadota bacterium]
NKCPGAKLFSIRTPAFFEVTPKSGKTFCAVEGKPYASINTEDVDFINIESIVVLQGVQRRV